MNQLAHWLGGNLPAAFAQLLFVRTSIAAHMRALQPRGCMTQTRHVRLQRLVVMEKLRLPQLAADHGNHARFSNTT